MRVSGAFPVRWAPKDGENGQGVTIKSTSVRYASSTSGTSHPTSGWEYDIPAMNNGNYLWTWTHVEYSDGTTTDAYSVSRKGQGVTIKSTSVRYASSTSGTSYPTSGWKDTVPTVSNGNYLWTWTLVKYSDGTTTNAYSVSRMGNDGEKGQGVTIKSTSVRYASSTSGTSHPTSGWKDTVPTVSNGNYLWTWTHVEYSDGTTTDAYSVSRMGNDGLQGCILRDFIWQEGYECHNDEKLSSWPRYLDIAYIDESVGVWKVYQCLKTHKASADKKPGTSGGASFWKVVDNMGPLYTPLLIADNAKIKIGQTNQLLITNSKNKIQGCFGGVEDETNGYPLWIGGETADAAKFKVKYGGQLYATDAVIQGVIRATSGIIGGTQVWNYQTNQNEIQGGFNISGSGLTYIVDGEMNKEDMAYIICRNDYYGRFAGIGANVLPALSGIAAVAVFENTDTQQWYGRNIAMILEAKNGTYNMAFTGTGDGVLNGDIIGYKFQKITCTSNIIKEVDLSKGTKVIFTNNASNSGLSLPTLNNVRLSLGLDNSTNFAIMMVFMQGYGSTTANVVYGKNKSITNVIKSSSSGFYSSLDTANIYSTYTIIEKDGVRATLSLYAGKVKKVKSGATTYYNIGTDFQNYWMNDSQYPQIWNDDKKNVDCVSMGIGDTRCFMLVYDNSLYGAYMIAQNY